MSRRLQIVGVWVVLAVIVLSVIATDPGQVPRIAYSDFRTLVKNEAVSVVDLSGSDAEVVLAPNWESKLAATPVHLPPGTTRVTATLLPVEDRDLVPELLRAGVVVRGEKTAFWASMLLSWVLPLGLLAVFWVFMIRRTNRSQGGVLSFGKSRVRVYRQDDVKTTFKDVAGVEEAKEELNEIVEYLREPGKFIRVGAKIPKGVLLVGPPGTGKTLLARAVAGEAHVAFFSISGSEFVEMFVGVGAARVRDLFETALKTAPCIIFIDELDALGKVRGINIAGANDEREQTLNQLLVEMDGFEPNAGVVLMAATNRAEILDPALLRPGRFDRQVLVDKPDRTGRLAILQVHVRGVVMGDVDLEKVARISPGFSGADLANLVNEAALLAARRGHDQVEQADFEEAIERVVAGLEKKGRIISDRERRIIAFHEVGHAIVAEVLPGQDRVQKVSIIPRGLSALGYTLQQPTEDRYLMTRGELLDRMTVLLGGRAAERIEIGEVSTGAANDLARATDIARSMIMRFGMGREVGPVSLDLRRGGAFGPAGGDPGVAYDHGGALADRVDVEIRELIEQVEARAGAILADRREALERISLRLLEREHLDGDELRALLAGGEGNS